MAKKTAPCHAGLPGERAWLICSEVASAARPCRAGVPNAEPSGGRAALDSHSRPDSAVWLTSGVFRMPFEKPTVLQTAPLCSPSGMNGSAAPKRSMGRPQYAELDDLYAPVRHEQLIIVRTESAFREQTGSQARSQRVLSSRFGLTRR